MSRHRSPAFVAALFAAVLLASVTAEATPIIGHSSGSFANLSGCGWPDQCRIEDSADGTDTRLRWGHYNFFGFAVGGSTLAAKDRAWSFDTVADDQIIAELVWRNTATFDLITPDVLDVDYILTIGFTAPGASGTAQSFGFSIFNPVNPPGDQLYGLDLADLSGLSFDLDGILVSDLKFSLGAGDDGTFGNHWFAPEGKVSKLYITADFSSLPVAVPEPGPLAMMAVGLAGLWLIRRRIGSDYRRPLPPV